jgi:hypothetical protein
MKAIADPEVETEEAEAGVVLTDGKQLLFFTISLFFVFFKQSSVLGIITSLEHLLGVLLGVISLLSLTGDKTLLFIKRLEGLISSKESTVESEELELFSQLSLNDEIFCVGSTVCETQVPVICAEGEFNEDGSVGVVDSGVNVCSSELSICTAF